MSIFGYNLKTKYKYILPVITSKCQHINMGELRVWYSFISLLPFNFTGSVFGNGPWSDNLLIRTTKDQVILTGCAMMTSSNEKQFPCNWPFVREFTGPGEFPTQRPVTRSFDAFYDLCLNKRLSKQPWGWWFETPSWSLWRQCNALESIVDLFW